MLTKSKFFGFLLLIASFACKSMEESALPEVENIEGFVLPEYMPLGMFVKSAPSVLAVETAIRTNQADDLIQLTNDLAFAPFRNEDMVTVDAYSSAWYKAGTTDLIDNLADKIKEVAIAEGVILRPAEEPSTRAFASSYVESAIEAEIAALEAKLATLRAELASHGQPSGPAYGFA